MEVKWKLFGDRYLISNQGLVYRLPHFTNGKNGSIRKRKGRFMKLTIDRNEYINVSIYGKDIRLNKLIATLFCPNPNNLKHITHKDNNKQNNQATNLIWSNKKNFYQQRNENITSIHKYINTKKTEKLITNHITHLQKTPKKNLELLTPNSTYINITYNNSLHSSLNLTAYVPYTHLYSLKLISTNWMRVSRLTVR